MKKNSKETNKERKYITEQDVLRKHHKFIRESDSQSSNESDSEPKQRSARKDKGNAYEKYGEEMSKKYYSKLFKQYALVDLSRYETGQVGCRWRTQKQVLAEKGQNICGSIGCEQPSIQKFQMNFGYIQQGTKKNALVKISLCDECSKKLNHKKSYKKIQSQTIETVQKKK